MFLTLNFSEKGLVVLMKLIVGLGSPGEKFRDTRHNAGFMVIDALAKDLNIDTYRNNNFQALLALATLSDVKLVVAKPQTYMNLSGQAVAQIVNWYKILPKDILVIYDDMDLPLGRLRFRSSGSSGGHNGIKSIISCLGTETFNRLRIGIGRPRTKDINEYVLGKFTCDELLVMDKVIECAKDGVKLFVKEGITAAMNKYNGFVIESDANLCK
ncbi:aminoacyl-tRNA hydrolase [Peptococcaceae bacterium]|nr:aminoacyl-tRNA hydrolase [Peptococcaceae bacterium]